MAGRRRQKMLSVVLVATAVFLVAVMHLASVIEDDVFTTGTQDLIPATIDPKPFAVIVGVPAVNTSSVTKPTSVTRTTPLPIKKPWNEPLGPGERGQGVKLTEDDVPDGAERELYRKLYDKYQYNAYLSDVVSLHRSLPLNVTDPMCLAKRYDQPLPTASVVVPFRDERRSMLLRTVHSVLDRSPPHLLKEVILVDDGSESDELKTSLDVYVALLERVKLLRLPESKGLMVSRNTGIRASSGDVIIVMDCHVEVAPGWLEPLLDRVREEPRALVFPTMDIVLENSMEYRYLPLTSERTMPAFNFYLDQAMTFLFSDMWRKRQDATRPVPVPAIQGWAFAMNRTYFLQLGGFDEGMQLWGAEQLELSFKVWMCGGRVELVPCSSAGHVYKRQVVWFREGLDGVPVRNALRVAAVWLDPPYSDLVMEALYNNTMDYGDVSARREIRKKNNCSSFQDYLDKIAKIAPLYIPVQQRARGLVMLQSTGECLQAGKFVTDIPVMATCLFMGFLQYWELTSQGHIRHADVCMGKDDKSLKVILRSCIFDKVETWSYTESSQILHLDSKRCLAPMPKSEEGLWLVKCTKAPRWNWHRLS